MGQLTDGWEVSGATPKAVGIAVGVVRSGISDADVGAIATGPKVGSIVLGVDDSGTRFGVAVGEPHAERMASATMNVIGVRRTCFIYRPYSQ
jgi:pyrimidine deaminase RibD-like protein